MDRISGLSEELLAKILSYLPTKVAVSTYILSKRWECIWMWLPKLDYICSERQKLRCFLNRTLPLHRAPVIESLRLDLYRSDCKPEDVILWVVIAVSRCLRELDISYVDYWDKKNILPSSLYACKSLAVLKLKGTFILDVPRMVSLPCLKTLQLKEVTGVNGLSLRRLLSICPVLENLSVHFCDSDLNIGKIIVIVHSLQSLSLYMPNRCNLDGLEINTPSLKYLKFEDPYDNYSCLIENMPQLEEAYVEVRYPDIKILIRSITSVKRLTLCSEVLYGSGFVFNQLEHLKLCHCTWCSAKLLARLLKDSPNLLVLDIFEMEAHGSGHMESWSHPRTVPTCLLSSLQTFSWSTYYGRTQDSEVAVYILKNARRSKTAKFFSDDSFNTDFEMLRELSLSSRASTTCELEFD